MGWALRLGRDQCVAPLIISIYNPSTLYAIKKTKKENFKDELLLFPTEGAKQIFI